VSFLRQRSTAGNDQTHVASKLILEFVEHEEIQERLEEGDGKVVAPQFVGGPEDSFYNRAAISCYGVKTLISKCIKSYGSVCLYLPNLASVAFLILSQMRGTPAISVGLSSARSPLLFFMAASVRVLVEP